MSPKLSRGSIERGIDADTGTHALDPNCERVQWTNWFCVTYLFYGVFGGGKCEY